MMRAARFHGHRDIRIDEVPIPTCGDGEVLIVPRFNGICGSDLHAFFDEAMATALKTPHPISGEAIPLTVGHEFSGTVKAVGKEVTSIAVGDRVCVQPIIHDGVCGACKRGAINCCRNIGFRGVHGYGGGLSDAIVVPPESVYKLPDTVDLEVGALIEPLAVGWHAVRLAGHISASSTALVQGSGPIGCAVILALKAKGVRTIVVTEISQARAGFAEDFGASRVVNPTETNVVDVAHSMTDGDGVDVVFDCAGVQESLTSGCKALRAHGTLVNLALWMQPSLLNATEFLKKEGTYKGALAYTAQDFDEVIAAIEDGSLRPHRMITKKIALQDVVKEGFEELHETSGHHCKILIDLNM